MRGTRLPPGLAAALGSGTLLQALNASMIAVAIVAIAAEFGGGESVAWVISGLYITTAVVSPIAGVLGALLGARRVYLAGLGVVVLGALVAALAPTLGWLIAGRVLLGIGTATQYPAAVTIIREVAERRSAPMTGALTILSVCAQSAVGFGPTLGGLLVAVAGWRSTMWVNLPLALLAALWVWRVVPDTPPTRARDRARGLLAELDLPGAFGLAATIATAMVFLLSVRGQARWWLLPVFAAMAAAFGWRELRARTPFIDLRGLAANRPLLRALARSTASYTAFYCVFLGLPYWLQTARGLGPGAAGALMVPLAVVGVLATAGGARVLHRRGPRPVLFAAGVSMAAAGVGLTFLETLAAVPALLIGVVVLLGLPNGLANIGNQNLIDAVTRIDEVGMALGMYRTMQYVAANLAAVVVALALYAPGGGGMPVLGAVVAGTGVVLAAEMVGPRHDGSVR